MWWCGLAVLLTIFEQPAQAQGDRAAVRMEGRVVFRVGPSAEAAAPARARRIEQRLTALAGKEGDIPGAEVTASGEERAILIGGVLIVTVSKSDADDHLLALDALAAQWAAALDEALARSEFRHRSGWVRFGVQVQASVRTAFSRLGESAITVVPGALAAILVICLFWAIASAVRVVMRAIFRRIVDDLTVENLIKQVAYYAVWFVGIFVAADALGFEPQSVVTGLGLTSLALGFALKDILSNFVSGLLILFMRPFELGDQISIGDTEGSVERIDLRATQIRTYDGRVALVPNADLFTSRIINNTASPCRRGAVEVFTGYELDVAKLVPLIRDAAQSAPGVMDEPPATVLIAQLGPSDIAFEVRYWSDSRRSDFVATASAVRLDILTALKETDTPLPEPNVRVLVPCDAAGWRDAFGPASPKT